MRQTQQSGERAIQQDLSRGGSFNQGVGNAPRVIGIVLPEYRADLRCAGRHIGEHDDDIARVQCGVGLECREQLIVQHL